MHDSWKSPEPGDSLLAEPLQRGRAGYPKQDLAQSSPSRICDLQLAQAFRPPKHFVRVPADPLPPKLADSIRDLNRTKTVGHQIAPMKHGIRGCDSQISNDGLKGRKIPVNVGYDCNSHRGPVPRVLGNRKYNI